MFDEESVRKTLLERQRTNADDPAVAGDIASGARLNETPGSPRNKRVPLR
jgi:hypothetical protein